jgi:Lrp/AsnC family transcriptional regulator
MDRIDLQILAILQEDATLTVAEIASRIGLSQTPCWRRIQKLEANGILLKRVALVSPEKVGCSLRAHVAIQAGEHSAESLQSFTAIVAAMPEVIEFSRMAGEIDFMLRVVFFDITAYDSFYKRLTAIMPLRNVSAHFVLQHIKSTTALPLQYGNDLEEIATPGMRQAVSASGR